MPKLTKRENVERQRAVLEFFLRHPEATGSEAQQALLTGQLTGRRESSRLGERLVYDLKKKAESQLRTQHGAALAAARRSGSLPSLSVPPPVSAGNGDHDPMTVVREHVNALRVALSALPDSVVSITVERSGSVRIRRIETREEDL
jgi:hypothetical protein